MKLWKLAILTALSMLAWFAIGYRIGQIHALRNIVTVSATKECGIEYAPKFAGCAARVREYDADGTLIHDYLLPLDAPVNRIFE